MRVSVLALGLCMAVAAGGVVASASTVETSPRPELRPAVSSARMPEQIAQVAAPNPAFRRWIAGFRKRALARGISAATFDRAFAHVRLNSYVLDKDRHQSEFTKTIWQYLDSAASPTRIANGRAAMRKYAHVLNQIEARYGVDKSVVVAIWGLESAYGTHRGDIPIVESLATLAFEGRRGKFFEGQLIDALKILQHGDTTPSHMVGSWAGAMGHTQFIPSSYMAYAVDFRGDGKRDIWSNDPTDALASTAAYLARFGWTKGQPWGVEVRLPKEFNYALASDKILKTPAEWRKLGIELANGRPLPNGGKGSILLPAGAQGAAFLIFHNFRVIEHYNSADAYVIAVGYLASRIEGGPAIRHGWPRSDRALTGSERRELQMRLTHAGFSTGGVDGRIGPMTIGAIRAYQHHAGLVPDGYASLALLKKLR